MKIANPAETSFLSYQSVHNFTFVILFELQFELKNRSIDTRPINAISGMSMSGAMNGSVGRGQ